MTRVLLDVIWEYFDWPTVRKFNVLRSNGKSSHTCNIMEHNTARLHACLTWYGRWFLAFWMRSTRTTPCPSTFVIGASCPTTSYSSVQYHTCCARPVVIPGGKGDTLSAAPPAALGSTFLTDDSS